MEVVFISLGEKKIQPDKGPRKQTKFSLSIFKQQRNKKVCSSLPLILMNIKEWQSDVGVDSNGKRSLITKDKHRYHPSLNGIKCESKQRCLRFQSNQSSVQMNHLNLTGEPCESITMQFILLRYLDSIYHWNLIRKWMAFMAVSFGIDNAQFVKNWARNFRLMLTALCGERKSPLSIRCLSYPIILCNKNDFKIQRNKSPIFNNINSKEKTVC